MAEEVEGWSEAPIWRGSGVKLYYLDHVLNSPSETNDRRGKGWRRSVVSVRSTVAHGQSGGGSRVGWGLQYAR